jgi:hypothetical protein
MGRLCYPMQQPSASTITKLSKLQEQKPAHTTIWSGGQKV